MVAEERKLRALFARALVLAVAPACSTHDTTKPDAAPADATTSDASAPSDASMMEGGGDPCALRTYNPQNGDLCANYYTLPCGLPNGIKPYQGCFFTYEDCATLCPMFNIACNTVDDSCMTDDGGEAGVFVPSDSGVKLECQFCYSGGPGRVPAGLERARFGRSRSALADYFARAAYLESAAVHAFRRMKRELAACGAPRAMIRAAARAERDEVRHARTMSAFARRASGDVPTPRVRRLPKRSLEAIALENAVEGCVNETYAALEAAWQARTASDAGIAKAMRAIARDEARHAALSWSFAKLLESRLSAAARTRVRRARDAAVKSLEANSMEPARELTTRAGLPDRATRLALLATLKGELWS